MINNESENLLSEFCDEDVTYAVKELKLGLNLSAEDLRKIYSYASTHARNRVASSTLVCDAMTRNVIAVNKFDDINHALKLLAEKNVSGLPVVDRENRVVGIISEADLVSMIGSNRPHTFRDYVRHFFGHHLPERKMGDIVGDIMTSPVVTIHSDTEISEAARLMDERRIRRLVVVDKEHRLVGIISRSDIVKTMGKKLSANDILQTNAR